MARQRLGLSIFGVLFAICVLSFLASTARATTAQEINVLPVLDALNLKEEAEPSNSWRELPWATSTGHKTGKETKTGWTPWSSTLTSGAYWKLTPYTDSSGGNAAALTMQVGPTDPARYLSLWLDMSNPDSVKNGYQLRWTVNSGSNYTVKLSKWSAGTETVLASNSSVSIAAGTTIAIADTGGTVTAWSGTGGSLTSLLSASDTAYTNGYAGLEGQGDLSRSINFKAGPLMGAAVGSSTVLDNLERDENPLAASNWAKPVWTESIGSTRMGAYRGYGSTGGDTAGAYWGQEKLQDTWGGTLVAGTVGTGATSEGQYLALWLNMPSPGTVRSGYEARFTGGGSASNYKVELSKWSSGTRTVLASTNGFSLPVGTTMALTKTGRGLVLWTGTTSLTPVLSANDGTYASGYASLEGSGSAGTVYNFKAARVGLPPIDTSITGGSKGTVLAPVSFSFAGPLGTTGFECAADAASYAACTSPKSYAVVPQGPHTFRVRALGLQGTDESPAERSIDVVIPDKVSTKVALRDNLERNEVPLATGSWSKSSWAGEIGAARMGSYRGYGSSGGLAGAYWTPATFTDTEGTTVVAGTVGTGATSEGQYLALWLNMPSPGTVRSGYEARFTGGGSASNYKVELSKWSSGTRTVLASTNGFSLPVGTTMALAETPGGNLAIYTGTTSMTPVLSAADSTYSSGAAGLEVNGGAGTIYGFRAGGIDIKAPETTITSGPPEIGPPSKASFALKSSEVPPTFECSLDGAAYGACASPQAYPNLTDGKHTFRARATDLVGNQDETPAEQVFWVYKQPSVKTGLAPNVNTSDATLGGEINPNGLPTFYQVEYGPTTAYGSKAPATPASAGQGTVSKWFSQNISGLQPNTRYHYRLVAGSSGGITYGEDRTFASDQTAPTLTFDSTYSQVSPNSYALAVQASDPGAGVGAGVQKLDILLNGEAVSAISEGCPDHKCPTTIDTNWTKAFDHALNGSDRLTIIAIDEVGNVLSRSFDLPSEVVKATTYTGNPSEGGTQLTEEWAQLYTHNSRLQEPHRTASRGSTPCPQNPAGGWCSVLRVVDPDDHFSEVSTPLDKPSAISEAGTLTLPAQADFGNVVSEGAINDILQPWQVLPPGAGSIYAKVVSKNDAAAPEGQAAQLSGEWSFWIDVATKLPLKASLKAGSEAPAVTYYSYSPTAMEAGSLSPSMFLVSRLTRQERGCVEQGQLGGWTYNEAGFTYPDPRFNSVVNTAAGPLLLRPEGAAIDGYEPRADLTENGVELTVNAPDEEELHWEVLESPEQTLEPAGTDVVVVSEGGVPSAVIQPSAASSVEVVDGEPDPTTNESNDEVVLESGSVSPSAEIQALETQAIEPPCITQAAITEAAAVHEEAVAAGVVMVKPQGSGSQTTTVKVWINPHPALSGVSVTDKYSSCNSPSTKTFGQDGYVEFGGCPVGKSVTFTVPHEVNAGGVTYMVPDASRTIQPPASGWTISYNYNAQASPPGAPPPPVEEPFEFNIGIGEFEADGSGAEASSEPPIDIPPQYDCYAGQSRPWRSNSATPNLWAARAKMLFRCRHTVYLDSWWFKWHLSRWVEQDNEWKHRAEKEPGGRGPAYENKGPFFIGAECRTINDNLLEEPMKRWRSEGTVFSLAEKPGGALYFVPPDFGAGDGKLLHCG